MIAASASAEFQLAIFSKIQIPERPPKSWFLWPVVCMYQSDLVVQNQIAAFFSQCPACLWETILHTINLVGSALGVSPDPVAHHFLIQLALYVSSNPNPPASEFMRLALLFMLYRIGDFSIWEQSVATVSSRAATAQDLNSRLAALEARQADLVVRFGPRLAEDKSGHRTQWLDTDLATAIFSLYVKFPQPDLEEHIILAAAFQTHFDVHSVQIIESQLNLKAHPGAAAVFAYHASLTQHNVNLGNPSKMLDSFKFLEEMNRRAHQAVSPIPFLNELNESIGLTRAKLAGMKRRCPGDGTRSLGEYMGSRADLANANEDLWHYYWKQVNRNETPWRQAFHSQPPSFRRDFALCGAHLCPSKLKISLNRSDDCPPLFAIPKSAVFARRYRCTEEELLWRLPCQIVKIGSVSEAILLVTTRALVLCKGEKLVKRLAAHDVLEIFARTYRQNQTAIELFAANRHSYFLNFTSTDSKVVLADLSKSSVFPVARMDTVSPRHFFESTDLTNRWANRSISNFEYLMNLNFFGGRSFRTIDFYPVMPWIVADYDAAEIALDRPSFFRNLADVSAESCNLHAINVCQYLIRLEPFGSHYTELTESTAGAPKLFQSIPLTYKSATKELTPEFFCCPEFLRDVALPAWASSPLDFVY
jgi:hypothetical protein